MPWCPKCRLEYQRGYVECPSCGADLVKKLEPEAKPQPKNPPIDLGPATFLISATNEHEANLVDSILKAEGIPTLIKHKDIGSYLTITTGMSNFGLDIYVPLTLVEKANEILGQDPLLNNAETEETPVNRDMVAKRRKRGGLILAVVLFPFLVWLCSVINSFITQMYQR